MLKISLLISGMCVALVAPTSAAEPLSIGLALPLTGNLGAEGQSIRQGITMAHKLCPRALGRPLHLRVVDTRSEKAEAVNAVFRLVEKHGVVALIGGLTPGNGMVGSCPAERRGIPVVIPAAMRSPVPGHRCVSRICPVDSDQRDTAAQIALHRLSARSAAILCDISQEYRLGMAACFRKEFTEGDGRIVCATKMRTGDRDFMAPIQTIRKAKPDVIYAAISHMESTLFARQMREMGIEIPIIVDEPLPRAEFARCRGTSAGKVLFVSEFSAWAIYTQTGKRLRDLCIHETGQPLQALQARGADAYLLVVDAITRAGSADPRRIREALSATSGFDGASGKIRIDTEDPRSESLSQAQ